MRYNGGMLGELFHTAIFDPLYNALVFLVSVVPFADVGIAVIILTVLVKLILLPLSVRATKTQLMLRLLQPELDKIKEKYKKNREEFARRMMELYRSYGVNPFSGILLLFIQLPIVFGLYWVFLKGGLPELNRDILYTFTPIPETFNMQFLWIPDIAGQSVILALLVGITFYIQMHFTLPKLGMRKEGASFQDDFARSMQMNMKFVFPVFLAGFAYFLSAAIALYFLTSNLFGIAQELLIRRKIEANFKKTHGDAAPKGALNPAYADK